MTGDAPYDKPGGKPDFHETLDDVAIGHLLELGLPETPRPVDVLIDRLQRSDGASWFDRQVAQGPLAASGNVDALETGEGLTLEMAEAAKEAGKRLLNESLSEDDRLGGLAGYFIACAAALTHLETSISSRPLTSLAVVLLDLAGAAPHRWSMLMERAVVAAGVSPDELD